MSDEEYVSDIDDEAARPAKRFKFQSYQKSLRDVQLPPALNQKTLGQDIGEKNSYFREALDRWRELNLSPAFVQFARQADTFSQSLPLLLHHWQEVVEAWNAALLKADDEAIKPLLDLMQKLTHDLRSTLSSKYSDILSRLLGLLPRSLSAASFSALMETLSALFKYLLIPSSDEFLVESSWSQLRVVLPSANPEVQRAVAEVWGSVLRRLRLASREKALSSLIHDLYGVEDAAAWALVFSCKSVSQTLHTSSAALLKPIFHMHLEGHAPALTFSLVRRVMTALIHHCKSAVEFTPVTDLVLSILKHEVGRSSDEHKHGRICRTLELAFVACAVREGSRLTQENVAAILEHCLGIEYDEGTHSKLLRLVSAALYAGQMPIWAGVGRRVLEHAWKLHPRLGVELFGTLSEAGWRGWKMIGAPLLLRRTPDGLDHVSDLMLRLLAKLHAANKLGEVDHVWKQRVGTWVVRELEDRTLSKEKVLKLHDIAAIVPLLSGIEPTLVHVVEEALRCTDAEADYAASFANAGVALASCLRALGDSSAESWHANVDLKTWTQAIVEKWGRNALVMESLVTLVESEHGKNISLKYDNIYPHLQESLLSHQQKLRVSALRLLSSKAVQKNSASEIVQNLLLAEGVSLDVQGVRERVLRMNRLGQNIPISDSKSAEISCRWLTAQLKVNLRPLWTTAGESLARLATSYGDIVWSLTFGELQRAVQSELPSSPTWLGENQAPAAQNGIHEDERTWRDPTAHKLLITAAKWENSDTRTEELIAIQRLADRLDLAAYQSQLIVTLGVAHSLAEKHGRQLIPFFLSLASDEAKPPLPRYKLTMWLELFAKFTNPKALYATDRMLALHTSLLAHPDKGLQSAALSCLMTYKPPHVHPHEATLRLLLDETRWRDALAQLDFAELPAQDRVEMVDVIIRLLYGVMLERRGRGRGADRRTAILSLFAACTSTELRLLVDLMLQSFSDHPEGIPWAPSPIPSTVSHKQQNGFLHLLADVIRNLGPHVVEEWHRLLSVTLDICANAQSLLTQAAPSDDDNHDEEQEDQEQGEVSNKGIRTARQLSLKRVTEFFGNRASFDFSPYLHGLFEHIISPRLAVFDRENTQAPSALMELFRVWATKHEFVLYLQKYDTTVLSRIFDCVNATNVKPTVVARIFDIVEMILGHAERDEKVAEALLLPNVEHLLSNLVRMVERSKGTDFANTQLGQRQLGILSRVAKHVQDEAQAATLLGLLLPMLLKTHKVVNDRVKADVLLVVRELLPLVTSIRDTSSPVYGQTYRTFSQLFQTIRARQGRLALVAAFVQLAELNPSIVTITTLLADLNAYSIKRMDEPDFDRRLQAFATLNRQVHSSLSADGWLPFLFNMLYFIQDANELAVRSSASLVLRQFIDRVGMEGEPFEHVFLRILYPALRNGLRTKNEMVRGEVLGVIAYSIQQCSNIAPLQEMRGLLADGDEEANFFNNVLHVQIHRRTRALRRLAEYADQDRLRNATITDIFVPLVENFVASTNEVDHHLVNEAILTLGRLARHLTWGSYYALVQSYLRVSKEKKEKDGSERVYVRTLVAILDSFHFPMGKLVEADAPESTEKTTTPTANTQKISDAVKGRLLPALLQHLENREGAEENIRLPIAIGIIQIALHLPEPARHAQISRLLTAVSQILRSKSQDTRDLVRETFRRVAVLLGSSYLPMILKELRAALTRGPQLHVLAFAVHNILAFVTAPEHIALFDNLNACVTDAVHVSAEVVFGESGKDVQSEDFKTNMKEVRSASSKGLDTFALLAQHIHPAHISGLLQPLRAILQETSSQKALNTVDDVLRRIASGLNANEFLQPVDLLPLCHTLISQNARFLQEASVQKANGKSSKVHNVTVQLKRKVHDEGNYYAANAFRFIIFGLDLFNTAYRRGRFDFKDAQIVARLEPMAAVIGNTLYSDNAQVTVHAMKAAVDVVKCPLKAIEKTLPVYVRQMMKILEDSGNTESEVAQASLKALSTIIRDCPSSQFREKDLVRLLEIITPDMEETARQSSVFSMLRAIVSRKFVVPEIYDVMDRVAEIMVTNQSSQVQETCRAIMLQFLLDYPQGKGRLTNQMTFLAKNLSYVHESGRKSVLELLGAVISKFNAPLLYQHVELLFVALVMTLANDESAKCREMSASLIQSLFSRLDDERRTAVLAYLRSWSDQREQARLCSVAAQVYGLFLDAFHGEAADQQSTILGIVNCLLEAFSQSDYDDSNSVEVEWRVSYQALLTASKLARDFPDVLTGTESIAWDTVVGCLLFPHAWVRLSAARLVGQLFAALPVSRSDEATPGPLIPPEQARRIAQNSCEQLKSEHLEQSLGLQVVKNLFYLGKLFAESPLPAWSSDAEAPETVEGGSDKYDDEEQEEAQREVHPLPWLFSKLSYQLRSSLISRRSRSMKNVNWSQQPSAILRWFAAMVSHLSKEDNERFLVHVLTPVYHLLDDDTIQDPHMDELKATAVELQGLVQGKVGTTQFADVYNRIRQGVLGVRRERKIARVLMATTRPDAAAKRKQHKHANQKESRKRKSVVLNEKRGKLPQKRLRKD